MPRKPVEEAIEYNPNEFDFSTQIKEFGYYLVLGKPRSGKTTVTKLVSQHLPSRNKAQAIVIAGAANVRKAWSEIVHPLHIHNGYTLEPDSGSKKDPGAQEAIHALDQIIKEQQRRVTFCENLGVPFPPEWEVNLFIDDCGAMSQFMSSNAMKYLAAERRQIMCTVFILIQKFVMACTTSREAADGVICLQTGFIDNIKGLHKQYCSMIPYAAFEIVLSGATESRGFLVIDAHPEKHEVEHMLFFSHTNYLHEKGHKAKLENIGSDLQWHFDAIHYKNPSRAAKQAAEQMLVEEQQPVEQQESKRKEKDPEDEDSAHEEENKASSSQTKHVFTKGLTTVRFRPKSALAKAKATAASAAA